MTLVLVVLPPTSEGGGEGATRSIKLSKLYWKNSLPAIEGHETVISVSVLQPASYAGLSWVNLGLRNITGVNRGQARVLTSPDEQTPGLKGSTG